ncbi:site-specific tyrosine recombinase XerD [Gulosibacter sp. 10]|uniref:site-specific tyrosine recombinase XerD n=1 Tax=Gulosibacter sp. 10 TaxID=1255570 RepID=UPI00097F0229|nr:site-specific tyrosine recombinase XerD [Gulosibacter sp. 10]SJM47462.1 Site-specific recombinase XerD [Gulosibacter sp. 10]
MSTGPGPERSELGRILDRYLRFLTIERGLSQHSVAAYERDLGRYLEFLDARGVREPRAIGAEHPRAFVAWLREAPEEGGLGLAASSASRSASSVRSLHRFMDEEGLVDEDVAGELRAPKLPRRLPKALTIAEVQALLDAAGGDEPAQLRDRALLELLYATGARVSEAVSLDVDDVIERDFVRVRGKGDKQRIVPLGSFAREALDAYLVRARPLFAAKGAGSPRLFLGVRGGPLSRQSAGLVLERIAKRAGMPGRVSPHTLRHSFATHLMQGGADVRVVQELLGHASVSTTQIYTKVTVDALREMYATSHPRALKG